MMMQSRPLGAPLPDDTWAQILELKIDGTDKAVRQALQHLLVNFTKARLSQDDIEHAQIVLGEALNNIVEHAFVNRNDGQIGLKSFRSKKTLKVIIMDDGAEMPNGIPPYDPQPEIKVDLDQLPEGGFGWHMIRTLTDRFEYKRDANRNILTVHIPISPTSLVPHS